jgi:hypothetical protein
MFQDLALQQGASQLQTASADLWTFLVHTPFQLMINLPLFIPTKFHHYRIVLLSSISLNKGTEFNRIIIIIIIIICIIYIVCRDNVVCRNIDVFGAKPVLHKHIL